MSNFKFDYFWGSLHILRQKKLRNESSNNTNYNRVLEHDISEDKETVNSSEKPNSIFLFGDLSLVSRTGKEISYMLSARLKHAFLLILSKTKDQGITSLELSEALWPDKTFEESKNSRGVTLNNLRKILNELDGVNLVFDKGKYRISISENCYCDYLRCVDIAKTGNEMNIEEFTSIVYRGKFLQNDDEATMDAFKETVESQVESTAYYYLEKAFNTGQHFFVNKLSDSIFSFDPLDEVALKYKIRALVHMEKINVAKQSYYHFLIEYKKAFDKDFEKTFEEIAKT